MSYVKRAKERENVVRDKEIELCIEDYLSERRQYLYDLLDEVG